MDAVKNIIVQTLTQFWWLVGVPIMLGMILFVIARSSRANYVKSVGAPFDTYFTGWIGTPVHEFGHWIFCIIFGHKVKEVSFYKPDKKSGTLGYVNHSYNRKNIYQVAGNFFIGMGPLFVGSIVILALAYFLLPNPMRLTNEFNDFIVSWPIEVSYGWKAAILSMVDNLLHMFKLLFVHANFSSISLWIFVFLSICISSHMALSSSDIKTAWVGMVAIVALLIVANIVSAVIVHYSDSANTYTLSNRLLLWCLKIGASMIFVLSFAIVMSMANFIISIILSFLFTRFNKSK